MLPPKLAVTVHVAGQSTGVVVGFGDKVGLGIVGSGVGPRPHSQPEQSQPYAASILSHVE